jgi:hypothetical protein
VHANGLREFRIGSIRAKVRTQKARALLRAGKLNGEEFDLGRLSEPESLASKPRIGCTEARQKAVIADDAHTDGVSVLGAAGCDTRKNGATLHLAYRNTEPGGSNRPLLARPAWAAA